MKDWLTTMGLDRDRQELIDRLRRGFLQGVTPGAVSLRIPNESVDHDYKCELFIREADEFDLGRFAELLTGLRLHLLEGTLRVARHREAVRVVVDLFGDPEVVVPPALPAVEPALLSEARVMLTATCGPAFQELAHAHREVVARTIATLATLGEAHPTWGHRLELRELGVPASARGPGFTVILNGFTEMDLRAWLQDGPRALPGVRATVDLRAHQLRLWVPLGEGGVV